MGGFHNGNLNQTFREHYYKLIVKALILGCDFMVKDCSHRHISLQNHEEKIRTHLLENYLENDNVRLSLGLEGVKIRFLPEVPESYDSITDNYVGRTDIRVVSSNWFQNRNDYYIVECKRIDGSASLNKKYVKEGICRFTASPPKYSSYNNKNIMLGFIVNPIDHNLVIANLSKFHKHILEDLIAKDITVLDSTNQYALCKSVYTNNLSLDHILYDISCIIEH